MATLAAGVDEKALIEEQIRMVALPEGVRFKSVNEGEDWEGDPVWRIYFSVSKRVPLTRPFIKKLNAFQSEVVNRVIRLRLGRFPLVDWKESR